MRELLYGGGTPRRFLGVGFGVGRGPDVQSFVPIAKVMITGKKQQANNRRPRRKKN